METINNTSTFRTKHRDNETGKRRHSPIVQELLRKVDKAFAKG